MAVTFPTTLDSFTDRNSGDTISEDHINDVQDAIELLEAKVGINTSAVDTSLDYKVNNFFVENTTKIWFYQASAPTGWTIDTSSKDNVLATKSDSGTYAAVGVDKGSYTYTGFTKDAHVHAMALHTHTLGNEAAASNNTQNIIVGYEGSETMIQGYTGGGGGVSCTRLSRVAANQSASNVGAQSDSGITSDGADRPKATVGVIATYTGA